MKINEKIDWKNVTKIACLTICWAVFTIILALSDEKVIQHKNLSIPVTGKCKEILNLKKIKKNKLLHVP